ncbi:MAG: ice-binding family protein, partial [Bacteroidales bacterium]|nr:ice-binding family protein [Bacteroidales bacterium]
MKSKLLLLLTIIALLSFRNNNFAQSPNLGAASNFALFTAAGELTNVGASVVTGDVGTYVGALTGFPPGIVIGEIYPVGHPILAQAAIDLGLAYTDLASRPCDVVLGTPFGNGQTLNPGVYCLGSAATLNGELILDGLGNPDALFIIQIDGALATSGNSSITLINGASIDNVYWQINGAFTLNEGSVFRGIIVANGQIELLEASTLYGQALSIAGAILLHNNLVTIPMPPEAPEVTVIQPDCLVPTGTIIVNSPLGPGLTYSIGAGYQSSSIFSSLAPGTYTVTVMNADGLISESISVTINAQPITPPPPEVVALQPDCFINTGTITVTSPLGPGFSYSIGGAYQSNPVFTEVLPNSYNVTVMSEDGCI